MGRWEWVRRLPPRIFEQTASEQKASWNIQIQPSYCHQSDRLQTACLIRRASGKLTEGKSHFLQLFFTYTYFLMNSKKSWTIWYRRGRIGLGGTVWFMGIILGWGTRTQTGLEAWKGTVFTLRRIVLLRSMRFSMMPCSGALLTLLAIKRPVKGPELEANWSEEGHRAKRAKLIRMGLRRYRRSTPKALF